MDGVGAGDVKALLGAHGFRFSRSMGQNFLIDGNIPEKIVRLSGVDEFCGVLEVGPGVGALTMELSRAAGRVVAVELDRRLLPILKDTLKERQNVEMVQGDILKIDIRELVGEKMPGLAHHVCANLPYNITSPAISAFIDAGVFTSITVMVQREVARRICAEPATPDYSAFSVYVNYHTEPRTLFDVPPECFMPRPNVWSSVVTMTMREKQILEPEHEKAFSEVVRAAFAQRRKMLVNALSSALGLSKEQITETVKACGFDTKARGETLSVEDFAKLARELVQIRYKHDT